MVVVRRRMPGRRDKVSSMGMAGDIDWSKTRAYAQGMYGNLNVNLRGREPQGIVEPADYESTREQLIEAADRGAFGLAYPIAGRSALIGEIEEAMTWLERAYEEREPLMLLAKTDPRLDPLRTDARFQNLLRRIGFPES